MVITKLLKRWWVVQVGRWGNSEDMALSLTGLHLTAKCEKCDYAAGTGRSAFCVCVCVPYV